MNSAPEKFAGPAFHRKLLVLLAAAALLLAWREMTVLAQAVRWHDKAEVNIKSVVDALALNSGVAPARIDQPGFPSHYLLALDYRLRHEAGLRVWNLRRLDMSTDPIQELAHLVHLGRQHSRMLVMLCLLAGAALCWRVTRNFETTCLAVVLLAGSSGLLFHGVVNRPELLAAAFGTMLAPLCLWLSHSSAAGSRRDAWLFAAGLACGGAALAKLPGVAYLFTSFAWCWLVGWTADTERTRDSDRSSSLWLLPLAGSLATLALLHLLAESAALSGYVTVRIRVVALIVALLPLLALSPSGLRRGAFLRTRLGELALLGGGALAIVPLSYLLLRLVMPVAPATGYMTEMVEFVFNAGPVNPYTQAAAPHGIRAFVAFVRESPFVFAGAAVLAVGLAFDRTVPARLKALVFLLLGNGLVVIAVLSRARFADPSSLFAQVPFLLAWAIALYGLGVWRPAAMPGDRGHWAAPIVFTAALVLVATISLRVRPKYLNYDTGPATGISDVTVTYLFNHNSLPEPYIALMERHYGTRAGFVESLERDLARPIPRP